MASVFEALGQNMADIKRPPPLPVGAYRAVVSKVPVEAEKIESDKGDFEKMIFGLKIVSEYDVDPEAMQDYRAQEGIVAGTPVRLDFFFDVGEEDESKQKFNSSLNRMKEFLVLLGVPENMNMIDGINAAQGATLLVEIDHRMGRNEGEIFLEVVRTLKDE